MSLPGVHAVHFLLRCGKQAVPHWWLGLSSPPRQNWCCRLGVSFLSKGFSGLLRRSSQLTCTLGKRCTLSIGSTLLVSYNAAAEECVPVTTLLATTDSRSILEPPVLVPLTIWCYIFPKRRSIRQMLEWCLQTKTHLWKNMSSGCWSLLEGSWGCWEMKPQHPLNIFRAPILHSSAE